MGEVIQLTAADGHQLNAYQAEPDGTPTAGILIIQEIFGITNHIKRVTDSYAAAGYLTLAPALFDRVGPDISVDYADMQTGRDAMGKVDPEDAVKDMAVAVAHLAAAGPVGAVGFCWGGALAYLAACRLPIQAAVSYYGGQIPRFLDETPACPMMYHFGAEDAHIPLSVVDEIRTARPEGVFHLYQGAGHGFNCDDRPDHRPDSAALALQRSLQFLASNL